MFKTLFIFSIILNIKAPHTILILSNHIFKFYLILPYFVRLVRLKIPLYSDAYLIPLSKNYYAYKIIIQLIIILLKPIYLNKIPPHANFETIPRLTRDAPVANE